MTVETTISRCCTKCLLEKPIDAFMLVKKGSSRYKTACRKCEYNRINTYMKTPRGKLIRERARSKVGGSRYSAARNAAKHRQREFNITRSEFFELVIKPCFYCTYPISTWGIALDRIDNTKGYEIGNVLPCCEICNRIRSNVFTVYEMKEILGPAIKQVRDKREAK